MRSTHKLGLIMLVVLLLALAMPNVSAEGTKFSKIYNFTDLTNNKAYEGLTNDTTTEIDDPYTTLTSIGDIYQDFLATNTNEYAYTRFEFKINESAGSITEINITWVGRGVNSNDKASDGYILSVYNVTGGSWSEKKSYSTDDTNQTEYIVNTSGFSDLINTSGYLKVLARSYDLSVANKDVTIETDYIDVNVTYLKIWNVSADKLTYKNGETISVTWDNEGGFGSGEDHLNVEYWDATAGTRFDLKNHTISANSSTSEVLTYNEGGHEIDVYVYTTPSQTGNNSTAITQGDPWPQTNINAVQSWQSYKKEAHATVWGNATHPYDSTNHVVYMYGEGFETSHPYKVGYYDATEVGGGDQVCVDCGGTSTVGGDFSSQFECMSTGAVPGLWHAVVFDTEGDIPGIYTDVESDPNYVITNDFTVQESAIPEFPAVIAAIAVCMLCAVAYMVMRRNEYGKE